MKRYKINKQTGKTKNWKYGGIADNYDSIIEEFETENGAFGVYGLRITDTETNIIIYQKEI